MKKLFIVAGESSGDIHASYLAKELRALSPDIKLSGIGGKSMQQAGVNIYYNIVDIAVIGLIEVLKNYKTFKFVFDLAAQKLKKDKPDAVILVDYPGFNMRLAKKAKELNIPVIYYISPQIWAWNFKRIKIIKNIVDKMIVLFDFEKTIYEKEGVNVSFTGHPLIDVVKPTDRKEDFLNSFHLNGNKLTVTFLPGSRVNELKKILPVMIKSAELIYEKNKNIQFIIAKSSGLSMNLFNNILSNSSLAFTLIENKTYDCLNVSDFVLVASGTATLETAISLCPMAIIYKVSQLSYWIIRSLIKIPYIGLVNVVAGKKIVPEFIQYQAKPKLIAEEVIATLNNQEKIKKIKQDLTVVKNKLGKKGASIRAAKEVLEFVNN